MAEIKYEEEEDGFYSDDIVKILKHKSKISQKGSDELNNLPNKINRKISEISWYSELSEKSKKNVEMRNVPNK